SRPRECETGLSKRVWHSYGLDGTKRSPAPSRRGRWAARWPPARRSTSSRWRGRSSFHRRWPRWRGPDGLTLSCRSAAWYADETQIRRDDGRDHRISTGRLVIGEKDDRRAGRRDLHRARDHATGQDLAFARSDPRPAQARAHAVARRFYLEVA